MSTATKDTTVTDIGGTLPYDPPAAVPSSPVSLEHLEELSFARDVFAGVALMGVLAHVDGRSCSADEVADMAYTYAEAMLRRRSR